MTTMIFIATYYFKKDSELRIRENNIMITDAIGARLNTEFGSIIQVVRFIVNELEQGTEKPLKEYDKFFISIGIYKSTGYALAPLKTTYNDEILTKAELSPADIENQIQIYTKHFQKSLEGEANLQNFSPGLKLETFAISIPYKTESKKLVVATIDYKKIRESFETKGNISKTILLNSSGNVIGHPEQNLLIKGENLYGLPIAKQMFTTNVSNGQTVFKKSGETFIGSFKKVGFANAGVISIISKDKALEEVYNIQRRNLVLMIISILVVFFIVYNFAKQITKPVLYLVEMTKKIKEGEFNIPVKVKTKDEIGLLEESFLQMGNGLAEREKVKDALAKFVNEDIAERALKGEIKLGGEKMLCVIFFSDIRGFTAMSEKLSPEDVVELLNEYMTQMVHCIDLTNGYVDKFIGDAIMATWGVPISKGNDAENAIDGAIMMRHVLINMNKKRKEEGKIEIKMGCGLNYGPVVAGQIGSEKKLQYTVIGDSVNLASRVEALNKPFGTDILITQDLYDMVQDIYHVEKMRQIKVKGKTEPQTIYAVLGKKNNPNTPKNVEELRMLVGIDFKPEPDDTKKGDGEEVKYEIL
ncbi:MAG: HAMP domain-containing protein [Leptospiraceae bacterium]|nr:HAMP domain-containing protein [Leptospiraceae bacterium]MCP5493674.1 HAMP domain-containing protein [Leptospiraceae bacterium]